MTLGETRADAPAITADAFASPLPSATLAPVDAPAESLAIASPGGRFAKRAFDLAVGVPLLLIATPLLIVLALLVVCTSRGPAMFRQQRPGRDGGLFTIWKFRSMQVDAESSLYTDPELSAEFAANGYKLPAHRDPRITGVGRFLRRTSLDELPQLLNVVSGSMSLVGPRPVLQEQATALYGDDIDLYYAVKPGLTGLWQVSGRSELPHEARARLDEQYVQEWTVLTDVVLLARTIPAVVSGRGAH
jgi:lipopolysaccharide/colanic/teichoic acid biosynthesis glycosyltransferase